MANKITTYTKIKSIRDTMKTIAAELQTAINGLPSSSYQTKGGALLSTHAEAIRKTLNRIEANLTEAHKAANALGDIKTKPKAGTISFKIAKCSGKQIIIDRDEANKIAMELATTSLLLSGTINTNLKRCQTEIENVKATEQLVSSVTAIDLLFPLKLVSKVVLIEIVKNIGISGLKQAQSDINKLSKYCRELNNSIYTSVEALAQCEEKVKSRTYDDLLNTTSKITEESNTPRQEIKDSIAALEAKQAEYKEFYGEESEAIKEEIARLKKLYGTEAINLTPNFEGHSMKQSDYALPKKGSNVGCCATAYAIGLSIIDRKFYNPEKNANANGGCTWVANGKYGYRINGYKSGMNCTAVYESLQKGLPTLLEYKHENTYPTHWVVISGIREGADPDHLSEDDFIIINPGDGKTYSIADIKKNNKGFEICGSKAFY